jgi:threonine dehydrogenase-like Zn-dependent dehydrogenase
VSVLGVFTGAVALDPYPLLLKEATLAWSNCYAQGPGRPDFERAIELLSAERERLARLLTHQRPLGEIEAAFALASDKRAGAVKVTVLT